MLFKKGFCSALLALAVAAVTAAPVLALEPNSDTIYQGIDVSVYQDTIDFDAVREDGKQAVYIRAGQGFDYVDPNYRTNFENASAAGLDAGFYYYVTATNTTDAEEQATTFAQLIDGYDYTMRPAMDYESYGGLSDSAINAVGLAFLEKLAALTGVTPVVYSDAYRTQTLWNAAYGAYPLWVAEYNGGAQPSDNDIWDSWSGYQYSNTGRVSGIDDDVDLDWFTPQVLTSTHMDTDGGSGGSSGTVTYVVKTGDTLWDIAQTYGTTVSAIVAANDIANPDLIYPGEVLLIPVSG
ncbi:MAG: LysM peptidoglycan-binding domain-containing protein [Clostridiales bacterium]|nr:LysM peptidoglycan-binding domain-containing protein [Clostridiales bacterium]